MESRLLRRPLAGLLSGRSQCLLALNGPAQRHDSSYRRTKQRLSVKPDSSFLLNESSPRQNHIIFNPPSSAPSPFHTPIKFLPKEDKRRQLLEATQARLLAKQPARLPPRASSRPELPHNHLKQEEIFEIQRLKRDDPEEWTMSKLARKFKCSVYFIGICLKYSGVDDTARRAALKARTEAKEAMMGPKRRKAAEEKNRRFELALRGD